MSPLFNDIQKKYSIPIYTKGKVMGERKEYLDVAKGLLMVLLIIHHLPQATSVFLGIQNSTLAILDQSTIIYSAFFMPCFFIITGYCSNFKKENLKYLVANIRSLFIPALLFTILSRFLYTILDFNPSCDFFTSLRWYILDYYHMLKFGSDFWFIDALFISKILYKGIITLFPNRWTDFLISFVFLLIGVWLNQHGLIENYWHFQHAFILLVFLCIGDNLKEWNVNPSIGFIYLVFIFALFIQDKEFIIPSITRNIAIPGIINIPLFLFLSLTGSSLLVDISRRISHNTFLQFMGVGSLIIYVIHHPWLVFLQRVWVKWVYVPVDIIDSLLFFVSILLVEIAVCACFVYLFRSRYLRWMTGR